MSHVCISDDRYCYACMDPPELLQIQPPQLSFVFELKKQSSCLVHLVNKASHYVAFKVKTTSPKKYCVRPTIGIIKPQGTCEFTVTMQAQRTAPSELNCKDKFLIQSTVVPSGTTQDHISSDLFSRESGKYVEEKKLRVILISPPSSPALLPLNGDLKQQQDTHFHLNSLKDSNVPSGVENIPPSLTVVGEGKRLETTPVMEEEEEDGTDEDIVSKRVDNESEMKQVEDEVMKLTKDYEELKSRLSILDSKLREAEGTITKLNEERHTNFREKDLLKLELEVLKRRSNRKRAQVGFPLMFVCVVAIVSVAVGYYIHP